MAFVISSGARSGVQSRFISIMDPMIIISLFGGGEMPVIYDACSSFFFLLSWIAQQAFWGGEGFIYQT